MKFSYQIKNNRFCKLINLDCFSLAIVLFLFDNAYNLDILAISWRNKAYNGDVAMV